MDSPDVQGSVPAQGAVGRVPDDGVPVQHFPMGARPPDAPQVHRHGRGPVQRVTGLLLLAHRMANVAQTSGRGV